MENINLDSDFIEFDEEFLDEYVQQPERREKDSFELKFVKILETVGRALLSKSQVPAIKIEKKQAAQKVAELLRVETAEDLTCEQVFKKVANLKQRVKEKSDLKRTGNKPINLKESEKLFLNLLQFNSNPSISPLKHGLEIGLSASKESRPLKKENAIMDSSEPPKPSGSNFSLAKKSRHAVVKPETSSEKLQITVLQCQQELISLQRSMLEDQNKRQNEVHERKMEILALKKKRLEEKLSQI